MTATTKRIGPKRKLDAKLRILKLLLPPLSSSGRDGADKVLKLWSRLTPKETRLCELLCDGLTNKQIAEARGLKIGSVKNSLRRIYDKIGADTRLQLVILLLEDKSDFSVKEI